jgi:hypothetical protein
VVPAQYAGRRNAGALHNKQLAITDKDKKLSAENIYCLHEKSVLL